MTGLSSARLTRAFCLLCSNASICSKLSLLLFFCSAATLAVFPTFETLSTLLMSSTLFTINVSAVISSLKLCCTFFCFIVLLYYIGTSCVLFIVSAHFLKILSNNFGNTVFIIRRCYDIRFFFYRRIRIFHGSAKTGIFNHGNVVHAVTAGNQFFLCSPSFSSSAARERSFATFFGTISKK